MDNSTPETILILLSKGHTGLIDRADADLAEFKWTALVKPNVVYAYRGVWVGTKKRKNHYLHRVIMSRILNRELLPTEEVDHWNHIGTDNRRENLRLATPFENRCNTPLRKDNTSGFKGVYWDKLRRKWSAEITHKGKKLHLGRFDTKEEAFEAYCKAGQERHGEFFNPG